MGQIDKHNRLVEEPFDYQVFKDHKIQIYWENRPVLFLKGLKAEALIQQLEDADDMDVQLILAKVTGNFKRGNEKSSKKNIKMR